MYEGDCIEVLSSWYLDRIQNHAHKHLLITTSPALLCILHWLS